MYLKIRPHRQTFMPIRLHPELSTHYYNTYIVLREVESTAYHLQLPKTSTILPVFHAYQLKFAVQSHHVGGCKVYYRKKFKNKNSQVLG